MKQTKTGSVIGWMSKRTWDEFKIHGALMVWDHPAKEPGFDEVEVEIVLKKVISNKIKKKVKKKT